ncbi:MAG: hypothetical protein H6752_08510 [Candidatus Omnitrophica bacterium]|nr:hypothetical protein [Candidatus Omnitrophota bacterium]
MDESVIEDAVIEDGRAVPREGISGLFEEGAVDSAIHKGKDLAVTHDHHIPRIAIHLFHNQILEPTGAGPGDQ